MSLILWVKPSGEFGSLAGSIMDRDDCFVHKGDVPPRAGSGDVVLVFGSTYVDVCRASGIITSKQHMNTLRKKVFGDDVKWLVTYSPGILIVDPSKWYDLVWDLKRAERLYDTGKVEPDLPPYKDAEDFSDVVRYVAESYNGKKVPLALDCETVGFYPYYDDKPMVSVQITYKEGQATVVILKDGQLTPKARTQLEWLLNNHRVSLIGANLKFDLHWIWQKFEIECTNFQFDTMLVGTLLDENRSNSLEMHAKVYTDIGGYDEAMAKKDKSRMDLVPRQELIDYAGGDSDATYRVARVFSRELKSDRRLKRFYTDLLHPAARGFEAIERTGVCVDRDKMDELGQELEGIMEQAQERALACLPRKLRIKHKDNLKPTKAALITDFMFTRFGLNLTPKMRTPKADKPATSEEHLKMFSEHPDAGPFIQAVLDYSGAQKTKSTYVDGFMQHLRPDGRLHPTYFLHVDEGGGATTGRTSAKDPAVQTIPKHTLWANKLRSAFIAPPGYVALALDYSQGELRVAADVADEPLMIKTYLENGDLHMLTGQAVCGLTKEELQALSKDELKFVRQNGKAGNFGLLYGMGAEGFVAWAYKAYGVELTVAQAQEYIEKHFRMYRGLSRWHDATKKLARRDGCVRSPLGRIRRVPLINSRNRELASRQERQAINSQIQSTLSDMQLLAIAGIHDRFGYDAQMCLMIHDQVVRYVPEDDLDTAFHQTQEIMESLPLDRFGWSPKVPFIADGEYGYNLGDMIELHT